MKHPPPDDRAALLSAILDVLREQHHVVHAVVLHETGEIEIRLDPSAPAQSDNDLDRWRAARRKRARQNVSSKS